MPENRFFLPEPFEKEKTALLTGDEFHHLTRVMRRTVGDCIEVVNGQNQLGLAQILTVEKKQATLLFQEITEKAPPPHQLILAQALTRPQNLDLIIEKGTELGATAFYLFPGLKSEKKELSLNQKNRLTALTISALKQCGRLDLPPILEKPPLLQWKQPPGHLLYGSLHPEAPYFTPLSGRDRLLFIGPEKGFTPEEEHFLSNKLHAKGIRFNPHILRAETAAICALSLLSLNS